MRMAVRLRRQVTGFALCAVIFAAIAPALSHWIASVTGRPQVGGCSVSALQHVTPNADSAPTPVEEGYAGASHCPFCRLQDHLPVLPAFSVSIALAPAAQTGVASVSEFGAFHRKALWAPALSRGPPVLS
jgi:hypothetical protein